MLILSEAARSFPHVQVPGGSKIHLQPVKDHTTEQVPEGGCDPRAGQCWSKLHEGPHGK